MIIILSRMYQQHEESVYLRSIICSETSPGNPPFTAVLSMSRYNPPKCVPYLPVKRASFFKLSAYIYFSYAWLCSTSVISRGYSAVDLAPHSFLSIHESHWADKWNFSARQHLASQTLFQQIILVKYLACLHCWGRTRKTQNGSKTTLLYVYRCCFSVDKTRLFDT